MSSMPMPRHEGPITESDRLFLERRRTPRHSISGHVTAVAQDGERAGEGHRICALQLLNISDTGLGVVAQQPLNLGTRVSVFFAPHGAEPGFDVNGVVVRCNAREAGHEVGLRLDHRLAA